MSSYQVALLLHITGVVVLIGGVMVAGAAFYGARRRERPSEIAAVLFLARVGVIVGGVGFATTLGFGLWLVALTPYELGDAWLSAAIALFAVSSALGAAGGQIPKRARVLAERLARERDEPSEELQRLLRDPRSEIINHLGDLPMIAALVLMVWKPGA